MKHTPIRKTVDPRLNVSETVVTADASKMGGKEFFNAVFARQIERDERDAKLAARLKDANERGDNKAAADVLLEMVAVTIGKPLSELKSETRTQWL